MRKNAFPAFILAIATLIATYGATSLMNFLPEVRIIIGIFFVVALFGCGIYIGKKTKDGSTIVTLLLSVLFIIFITSAFSALTYPKDNLLMVGIMFTNLIAVLAFLPAGVGYSLE